MNDATLERGHPRGVWTIRRTDVRVKRKSVAFFNRLLWHLCENLAYIPFNTFAFGNLPLCAPNRINRLFFRHANECTTNHVGFIRCHATTNHAVYE